MDRQAWHNLDQKTFDKIFHHTAIERAGYKKLMQNFSYLIQEE